MAYDMRPIEERHMQWQGGGKGFDDKSRYEVKSHDMTSRYGNASLDTKPRYTGGHDMTPRYGGGGHDLTPAYDMRPHDTRPQFGMPSISREDKYTFPHLVRKLNDMVQEQSKSFVDLVGISSLNDNQLKEMRFSMFAYIGKFALWLILASFIGAGFIIVVNSLVMKIILFFISIGLFWLTVLVVTGVLLTGEKNVHTELGHVTFEIYESYASPWRQFVKFCVVYILAWEFIVLLPMALDITYFVEMFKVSNLLYVPASFVIDYKSLTFVDFILLLGITVAIGYYSFKYITKIEIQTERERQERLNDIYKKSGKFELLENAKREVFGEI